MQYYNRGNKSKMNYWCSDMCDCQACNSKHRFIPRTSIKNKVKKDIENILNGETVKLWETCDGCKYSPRYLLRQVCAECDDYENYEAS